MSFHLFNSIQTSDNKVSNSYMIKSALACSGKVMRLQGFQCNDSTVTLYDKPKDGGEINSFSELTSLHKEAEIGMCIFHGDYLDNHVDITIDFETDMLYIAADSLEIIESIIKTLEADDKMISGSKGQCCSCLHESKH